MSEESSSDESSNQEQTPDTDMAEMMADIQKTREFWDASVERERAAGDRYMGDYVVNNYTIDADRIEFLIGIGSAIVTLVLVANVLLAQSAGIEVPTTIQVSATIAIVFLIDWYRHRE